jgi:hypothetical protein
MASQGSQNFNTHELLGMEKIHVKLIRIGVGHLTSLKQCDIRSFFVSSERSLPDLMTHYDVLLLLFTILK